jgi:hypothetical protein
VIKHYQWELDQVAISPEEQACSADWLSVPDHEHVCKSTLSSIHQSLAVKCHSSIWMYIFIILSVLSAFLLTIFIKYVIITRHLVTYRNHPL